MLITKILNGMDTGNPKPTVNWDLMKETIETRAGYYTSRVVSTTLPPCGWAHLVSQLLNKIPVFDLLKIPSETTMYSVVLSTVVPSMEQILAPGYIIKQREDCFVSALNNAHAQEFIIPCKSETPLMDLPLMSTNFDEWSKVMPVRILYCDTRELCSDILSGQFKFKTDIPSTLIATIDCCHLAFQYIFYVKEVLKNGVPSKYDFIRKMVFPSLYEDIVNCWILNIIKNLAEDSKEVICTTQNNIVNNAVVQMGLNEVTNFLRTVECSQFRAGDFYVTPWLTTGTIRKYAEFIKKRQSMEHLRHCAYLKFMIDYPIAKIIMLINKLSGKAIDVRNNRLLSIDLQRYRIAKLMNSCSSYELRKKLEEQLDELIDIYDVDTVSL